mmetsp:Transcript_7778/g.25758  ORF Transcript_7778/g.25758 Transcript_7778/m.25758 type:complete len:210 (-) Transcript_7778:617-1246(-)
MFTLYPLNVVYPRVKGKEAAAPPMYSSHRTTRLRMFVVVSSNAPSVGSNSTSSSAPNVAIIAAPWLRPMSRKSNNARSMLVSSMKLPANATVASMLCTACGAPPGTNKTSPGPKSTSHRRAYFANAIRVSSNVDNAGSAGSSVPRRQLGCKYAVSSRWNTVHRFVPRTCAMKKWPCHWSTCKLERVSFAATNRDGHERLNACNLIVCCA